jgi:LETM1-like protein
MLENRPYGTFPLKIGKKKLPRPQILGTLTGFSISPADGIVSTAPTFFLPSKNRHLRPIVVATFLAVRAMRSSLSRSACVSRSIQPFLQGRSHLYLPSRRIECTQVRRLSKQTLQRKHTTGATTTNAKISQFSARDNVTELEGRPPLRSISQEALATSSYDLAPTVPYPQNDLSSTRPAPLDLPDGPTREKNGSVPIQNRASYFYQLGKAYLKFYKTGFKNIWSNYQEYRDLRKRFYGLDINACIKHGSDPKISRRDFQLYRRTEHDLKKLIPFGLVFAICGEFTPLVIPLLGTAVVPYTCWIPKQVEKNLERVIERIEKVEGNKQEEGEVRISPALAYVHGLGLFGLTIRETPLLSAPLRRSWIESRLKQRLDDLICDSILILKEGGTARLEPAELFQFAINLRKRDTIHTLLSYSASGDPSLFPEPTLKQTQQETQIFIDEIRRSLVQQEKAGATYQPEAIFVAASQRAAAASGGQGPYLPPWGRVREEGGGGGGAGGGGT